MDQVLREHQQTREDQENYERWRGLHQEQQQDIVRILNDPDFDPLEGMTFHSESVEDIPKTAQMSSAPVVRRQGRNVRRKTILTVTVVEVIQRSTWNVYGRTVRDVETCDSSFLFRIPGASVDSENHKWTSQGVGWCSTSFNYKDLMRTGRFTMWMQLGPHGVISRSDDES